MIQWTSRIAALACSWCVFGLAGAFAPVTLGLTFTEWQSDRGDGARAHKELHEAP